MNLDFGKFGNFEKNSKMDEDRAQYTVSLQEKTMVLGVKYYIKTGTKISCPVQFYLIS